MASDEKKKPKGKGTAEGKAPKERRIAQIIEVWKMTAKIDRKLSIWVIGVLLACIALGVILGFTLDHKIIYPILGVLLGLTAAMMTFSRRAQKAIYSQAEDQPGASSQITNQIRGGYWKTEAMVEFNRHQDMVHRVVGPPGVVLLGEGDPARLTTLLTQQKRKISRVASEVPVFDVIVGHGEGKVPLSKLQKHLMRLPRNYKSSQVHQIEGRMRALGGVNIPIPKGPLPKGVKMPKMPKGGPQPKK